MDRARMTKPTFSILGLVFTCSWFLLLSMKFQKLVVNYAVVDEILAVVLSSVVSRATVRGHDLGGRGACAT